MALSTGSGRVDAALADPEIRYYIDREIRYGQSRALEVVLACFMVTYGVILLWPSPTFVTPGYRVISQFVYEWQAGSLSLAAGLTRLQALKINGRGRRTPIPRVLGCLAGFAFWSAISLGFALAYPPLSSGLAIYPVLALAELWSSRRAGADAFVLDTLGTRRRERAREQEQKRQEQERGLVRIAPAG